ncbi:MAG: peptide chain release factor N(5)-glutamine methyltransferase [Termitinemataceae bacterium]|nr:MAG: peptide chain release factor N(5)-glutamine methyltransferase [Termitinemataceae bacterium]
MIIAEALGAAKLFLQNNQAVNANIETPALDAALLLAEILKIDRLKLLLKANEEIDADVYACYQSCLRKRSGGICTAYITGHKEFRYLDLIVTPDVLVPRPDTETLVDAALTFIDWCREDAYPAGEQHTPSTCGGVVSVLDLCTGSGAVGLSLASERNFTDVWASDISQAALEVARLNAVKNAIDANRIHFAASNFFEGITKRFDCIVGNPPYVPSGIIVTLSAEVQNEPHLALDGGTDGLDIITKIIAASPQFLNPCGTLLLEADPSQMETIASLMKCAGFCCIKTYRDLAGCTRVIGARYRPAHFLQ